MIHCISRSAIAIALLWMPRLCFGNPGTARVLRQYPIPDAVEETIVTNIGITASVPYAEGALAEGDAVSILGSRSGSHSTLLGLSDDHETLIIHPVTPFVYDETVRVLVCTELASGERLNDTFQFQTMPRAMPSEPMLKRMDAYLLSAPPDSERIADTLPPMVVSRDDNPSPGTIYFSNFTVQGPKNNTFLFVLDEHGAVLKKENLGHTVGMDFKQEPNGMLTYFNSSTWKYYEMDSTWNVVDSFTSADGYPLDVHELRVFPTGDMRCSQFLQPLSIAVSGNAEWSMVPPSEAT